MDSFLGVPALTASLVAAVVATAGILLVFFREDLALRHRSAVIAFASGLLVATALLHLVPEALSDDIHAAWFILGGFVGLWLLDTLLERGHKGNDTIAALFVPLIAIGFHSFVDGLEYSVLYAESLYTGMLATSGLIVHEFAEGVIVFTLVRSAGRGALTAVLCGLIFAAATTPFGAWLSWQALTSLDENNMGVLLAIAAGALLYVGGSHLPRHQEPGENGIKTVYFLLAIAIGSMVALAHGGEGHDHTMLDHIPHHSE